jgi:dihydrofolate reductase
VRKVVTGLFISLDGVVESPDQWQHAFDEQMGAQLAKTLESADAVLLGRVTFQEWAGYWPTVTSGEDSGFADWINNSPKYVASTTLRDVSGWANSTLLHGDLADAVRELKAGDGGDISVAGSPSVVRALLAAGLLDELVLLIHPVVAGGGRAKLFADDAALTRLDLVGAEATSSGTIIATYRPKPGPGST